MARRALAYTVIRCSLARRRRYALMGKFLFSVFSVSLTVGLYNGYRHFFTAAFNEEDGE